MAWRRLADQALVATGIVVTITLLVVFVQISAIGHDFRACILPASHAFLHGENPYTRPGCFYAYPPPIALAATPALLVSSQIAGVIASCLALGAILGSLLIVGCRDPRCYALAALSAPVVFEMQEANATALVCLAAACSWRYRSPLSVGAATAVKLILAPVALWLGFQSLRKLLVAALSAIGIVVVSWALVGFDGIADYPSTVRADAAAVKGQTYAIGWIGTAIALLLLLAAWYQRRNAEVSFTLTIGACVIGPPIVLIHYFVLALIPLAIRWPRLAWPWVIPLAYWVLPGTRAPAGWQHAAGLLCTACLLGASALAALSAPRLGTSPGEAGASA